MIRPLFYRFQPKYSWYWTKPVIYRIEPVKKRMDHLWMSHLLIKTDRFWFGRGDKITKVH